VVYSTSVHKTGRSLYIYLHYAQRIYTKSLCTRPITSIARPHLPYLFPLHPHAWSPGQSTRGVTELGGKASLMHFVDGVVVD